MVQGSVDSGAQAIRRRAFALVVVIALAAGGCQTTAPAASCVRDGDCPPSTVCEGKLCGAVPCAMDSPCKGDRICQGGLCGAAPKSTPGGTLAAGGAVSQSEKHIHVGLTGQGRAVGPGASATHEHTTGAVKVMGR